MWTREIRQIRPAELDECELLRSGPSLDLLLPGERILDAVERLGIDQAHRATSAGEFRTHISVVVVLPDPRLDVDEVRAAGVERAVRAFDDVCPCHSSILPSSRGPEPGCGELVSLRRAQGPGGACPFDGLRDRVGCVPSTGSGTGYAERLGRGKAASA
ncbi:hypothetical protein MICRO8M_80281 [Microbacterium sp. 8M]|nr:hypothetical protein MICRO8M_80281 [Microbacterium sp. 8M]